MRHLGVLRGAGILFCGDAELGRAEYDLDGYTTRPGEVIASGEIRMAAEALNNSFGRQGLSLRTDGGRVLLVRFSGKRLDVGSTFAHADVSGELPAAAEWRR